MNPDIDAIAENQEICNPLEGDPNMKKVRSWPICLMALLVAPAIMISSAWAGAKDPPKIDAALVTPAGGGSYDLDLSGENLLCDDADELEVWIGGIKVEVFGDKTEDSLEILDPAGITGPGTYQLSLANDCGRVEYEVSVETLYDLSAKVYIRTEAGGAFAAYCDSGDVAIAGGGSCPSGYMLIGSGLQGRSGWQLLCGKFDGSDPPVAPTDLDVICLRP